MYKKISKLGIAATSLLAWLCIQSFAMASEGGAADLIMEEILVTATKKSTAENVQTVPIAVTALSGEALEASKMTNMSDLQVAVPNVQLERHSTVAGATSFNIRGLGTGSSIPSDDPPVGVFQDGVVMGILHGSNLDVFDLESIEVLRGPQGTLFGRNVTAGAIVARTRRPSFEPSADFRITTGSDGRLDAAVRGTGPLMEDKVAGKLTVLYRSHDGHYDNDFVGTPTTELFGESLSFDSDFGETDSLLIRPSLRFTPNDELTIDVIAEYAEYDSDGTPWRAVFSPFGAPLPDCDQCIIAQHNGLNELESRGVTVDLNWQTENGVLTSITAYREHETTTIFDTEGSAADVFEFFINPDQDQFSQEIRWAGTPFGNDVELTVGAYYFAQEVVYREGRLIFGFVNQGLGGDIEHDTAGVFSNVSWPVNDKLLVNAGLRYTTESKDVKQVVGQTNGFCDVVTGDCTFNLVDDNDWNNVTPMLSAQYQIDEDTMVWGSFRRGFRSGGFNLRHTNETLSPRYDEEQVDSFEIGIKTELNDVVRINASYFNNIYDDQQVVRLNPDASQVVVNAAETNVWGIDLEVAWLVTDTFSVSWNLGWIDADVEELDPGVLDATNAGRAVTNFPRIDDPSAPQGLPPLEESDVGLGFPEFTSGLSLVWDFPLSGGSYLTTRVSASYVDEWITGNKIYEFPSTTWVNAVLTYTPGAGAWSVSLYGTNLTDELYLNGYVESALGIVAVEDPSTLWALEFEYSL